MADLPTLGDNAHTTPTPWTALPAPATLGHPPGTWLVVGPRTDNGEPHTIAIVTTAMAVQAQ